MKFRPKRFRRLCKKLSAVNYFGDDKSAARALNDEHDVATLVDTGAAYLPLIYRKQYVSSLREIIPSLLIRLKEIDDSKKAHFLERLLAPVYAHAPPHPSPDIRPQLRRFLAVVSNLYRSFNDRNKRKPLNIPVVEEIPPLAFFQVSGTQGPYTITSDHIKKEVGSTIGVVSLPAAYRDHPILWSILAHEVCGHDVVHADPALIPELVREVRRLFVGRHFSPSETPDVDTLNALLWSYWIDEAVSDVYAIMNIGPTYALILIALRSSMEMHNRTSKGKHAKSLGKLQTRSGPRDPDHGDFRMDDHPTDILRPYLAIGAIESLVGLPLHARNAYSTAVRDAVNLTNGDTGRIHLEGLVGITDTNWVHVKKTVPLHAMQSAAKRVGAFIATARLSAYSGFSVQDVESWDEIDEQTATRIANNLHSDRSVVGQGDDAQLLAGGNLAVLRNPNRYSAVGTLLESALDDSFNRDPIWGGPRLDLMFSPAFCREIASRRRNDHEYK